MDHQELAQTKAELKCEIAEVKYRLEQAVKDQNDKFNALLVYLDISLEKVTPTTTKYKVFRKETP